jgi:hypothetical protein
MLRSLHQFKPAIHWLTVIIIALILCITARNEKRHTYNFVLRWDVYGYSMYNSTVLLQKDLKHPSYLDTIDVLYKPAADGYARNVLPNGNTVFKYTLGNSLMTLPFYYLGHLEAKRKGWPVDGMSLPYQKAVLIATLFWSILGLIFLTLALRQRFSPVVTSITLLLIALGTNFFYYSSYETGLTHPLNFFWFAFGSWAATRWLRNYRWTDVMLSGIAGGFIGLVRPTDLVFGLFIAVLFLATIARLESTKQKKRLFVQAIAAVVIALLILSIQLIYWKWISGKWMVDSYPGEHFDFSHPHITDGLFSYKKGWYVYTPVAFFATMGIVTLWLRDRLLATAIAAFLVINIYITFSWQQWWYGGSFGARPMIPTLALLALPLAALVETVLAKWRRNRFVLTAFIISGLFFLSLNIFQSHQYDHNVLHWDRMSKETYWKTFGRSRLSHEEFVRLYGE